MHDFAMHIGEAVIATLEAISESLVIEAQEMQHGRLQVVDVDQILR